MPEVISIRLLNPSMCKGCRFEAFVPVLDEETATVFNMRKCLRGDCDNWVTKENGSTKLIDLMDIVVKYDE
jgi:hypothetical protein